MSRLISELLGATEPNFSLTLRHLETASTSPSIDVRLTAEIVALVRSKIKELGLDPDDTTGRELYFALLVQLEKDNERLLNHLSDTKTKAKQPIMPLLTKAWKELVTTRTVWVLKQSVAKALLKKCPPKQVMKELGYRSVDSMLKREKVSELYCAMRFIEAPEWLERFNQMYRTVSPRDFESRKVELIEVNGSRWASGSEPFVHHRRHTVTHLKELGVIGVLPGDGSAKGELIFSLALVLHYLNEIRLYSAYFKMQQVTPQFGEILSKTILDDPVSELMMGKQPIHWRVVQRHFGHASNTFHPEIFEPHVQPEDLQWHHIGESLTQIDPTITFWRGLEHVGVRYDSRPLSFHVLDVALSSVHALPYGHQAVYYFRENLWSEVFIRYLSQKTFEEQILGQLDNHMITI